MDIFIPAFIMAIIGMTHALSGDKRGASLARTLSPSSTRHEKYRIFSIELAVCFVAGLGATLVWVIGALLWSGVLVVFHRAPDLPAYMLVISFYLLGYILTSMVRTVHEIRVRGTMTS